MMLPDKYISRNSDRYTFKTCRQLWHYSSYNRLNLEPRIGYKPFEEGSAWHAGMEVWYDPDLWTKSPTIRRDLAIGRYTRETAEARRRAVEINGGDDLDPEQEIDFAERVERGVGMLKHFAMWAPTVDNFTPIAVEQEFEVPIKNLEGKPLFIKGVPVVYQGRLDGLVQDPQGRYWILEHKTTGQMGRTDHLALDPQCGSYLWALGEAGIHCAGVVYTQALKDTIKTPKQLNRPTGGRRFSVNKQSRMTHDWMVNFLVQNNEPLQPYEEYLMYLKEQPNPFFRRIQVHRSPHSIKYVGEMLYREAVEIFNDPQIYPSPSYFNCNGCRFREPCIALQNGLDEEFLLKELFIQRQK